jgi:hypothetical protein
VLAFAALGGVPARIRYDNLKPAVVRVLRGRDRTESERFIALRSHYGYDSFFCLPGKEGAHEKGGVEGEIGRFRRRHLVPVPDVASLAELNALIAAADLADDSRVITGRPVTIGAAFAAELPQLGAAAGRAVRCRAAAGRAGGQPGAGVGAPVLLLGAGPLRRSPAAGAALGHHGGSARRGADRGPSRTSSWPLPGGPRPGPLPRGAQDQARGAARGDRARAGQGMRGGVPMLDVKLLGAWGGVRGVGSGRRCGAWRTGRRSGGVRGR